MSTFIDLTHKEGQTLHFDKKGHYVVFMHNTSGKFVFELAARGVEVDIFGLFEGKSQDDFQIETVQHHLAQGSTSNLLIKGVFAESSRFDYSGLTRIEKEGQQSHAYQKNQNLLLSPDSFVQSKPFLEILANDVFCTHGSTTGKLNEEQIFYIKSRGVTQKEAMRLIIDGFVNEVYDKVRQKVPKFRPL